MSHGVGLKPRKDLSKGGECSDKMALLDADGRQRTKQAHGMETEAEEIRYVYILNRVLPPEIRVLAWCPVNVTFTARFSCTSRTYKYFFPRGNLDLASMLKAARSLIGEHDFRNLCKMDVGNGVVTYRRRITAVDLAPCRHQSQCSRTKTKTTSDFSMHNLPTEGDAAANVNDRDFIDAEDGYGIYELTITGQAFLWHQIRCIVAVLFLIGQGRENPSIVSELLDVERHPRKPQYTMAAEFPLMLFDCSYDNDDIDWRYDSGDDVVRSLQAVWTQHSVRAAMLRTMLTELGNCNHQHIDSLVPGSRSRTYKPLFERDMCESLEDRIGHYCKKQKRSLIDANDRSISTQLDMSDSL